MKSWCSTPRALLACAVLALGGGAAASAAQAPGLAAMRDVKPGQWRLTEAGGRTREVCVADVASLFQLRSRAGRCSRLVVEDDASSATVNYTCPGVGHGQTTISPETGRLMRIDSQGINRGVPFDLSIEARRIGDCGPRRAGRRTH